jgi:heptaprenyl diphosphate synthase
VKSKRIAYLGLLTALAMILSFVESQIPALMAVPGIKVGLPNIAIVFILYKMGAKEAVAVSFVRIFLVSLLFGNLQVLTFSIAGAFLSMLGMILLKKTNLFSSVAVSIVGGILHNVGQIIAACIWTQTAEVALYLPVLLISGLVTGGAIGLVAGMLVKRLEKWNI